MEEAPITPEQTAALLAYLKACKTERQALPPSERQMLRPLIIYVLGKEHTGRHGVISWLWQGTRYDWYDPTDNGCQMKAVQIQGQQVLLEFQQSLGDDSGPTLMSRNSASKADAHMLVYDVADRISFEVINHVYEELLAGSAAKKPLWVVANKHGKFNRNRDVTEWAVTPQEGYQFAASIGARYWTVATNTGQNLGKEQADEIAIRVLLSKIDMEAASVQAEGDAEAEGDLDQARGIRSRWSVHGGIGKLKSMFHPK
ncbi:Fc.00g028460.m01.CDS01 [Cosmosporella sp. VM-42]